MMEKLKNYLFSPTLTLWLLSLISILLAVATFIEQYSSTSMARMIVYHNPLFYLLLLLSLINFLGMLFTKKEYLKVRRMGMILFHGAFVFVLLGALVTHWYGYEGILHVREGESTSSIRIETKEGKGEIRTLPFRVDLIDFRLIRYPGSHSPSSYESDLVIGSSEGERREMISMNKVVHEGGYRLYQSSFDPDERGTVLTVNYDPVGSMLSYWGYFMLFLSILWILLLPGSRFYTLRKELSAMGRSKKLGILVLLFTCVGSQLSAVEMSRYVPTKGQAEQFGQLLVQCPSGRIEPVDTYSRKLLRKLYRSDQFEGLSADQVLLGIMIYPEYWGQVPLLRNTNKELRAYIGTEGKYLPFQALFDDAGNYRLASEVEKAYAKPAKERTTFDKDLLKLDEKANLFYALQQGEYLRLFPLPDDPAKRWFSPGDDLSAFRGKDSLFVSKIFSYYAVALDESRSHSSEDHTSQIVSLLTKYQQAQSMETLIDSRRVEWELLYNRFNIFQMSAPLYALLGFLLLLFSTIRLYRSRKWLTVVAWGISGVIFIVFLLQTAALGIRWYISSQAPVSNAFETMVFIGWASVLGGLLFVYRSKFALGLATLLGGVTLFVAHLNFMDPEITPLVPVLKSPWLMIHVAVITSAYAFFGMSFLLSIFSLILSKFKGTRDQVKTQRELRVINELTLILGVCLMTAGTFLGAIWANESWGRYWGWDPKETWALITMLVYAFVLHARMVRSLRSDYAYHLLSIYAFLSVLMTYFGVNYFLSGLHSYGKGTAPSALWVIGVVYLLVTVLAIVAYPSKKDNGFQRNELEA